MADVTSVVGGCHISMSSLQLLPQGLALPLTRTQGRLQGCDISLSRASSQKGFKSGIDIDNNQTLVYGKLAITIHPSTWLPGNGSAILPTQQT